MPAEVKSVPARGCAHRNPATSGVRELYSVRVDGALQSHGVRPPSRISDETRYRYHSTYMLTADVTSKTTTSSASRAVKILSVFR